MPGYVFTSKRYSVWAQRILRLDNVELKKSNRSVKKRINVFDKFTFTFLALSIIGVALLFVFIENEYDILFYTMAIALFIGTTGLFSMIVILLFKRMWKSFFLAATLFLFSIAAVHFAFNALTLWARSY